MKGLRFDAIGYRRDMIATAHSRIDNWRFGADNRASPISFNDWLVWDKALYWTSGKPGSGKPALMVCLVFIIRLRIVSK